MAGSVIRRVDAQGRVVIPESIRDRLRLDSIELFLDDDRIVLRPYRRGCVVCGQAEQLVSAGCELVCRPCLRRLAEEPRKGDG